jgi:Ohr subfamily peroxiredoxin
MSIIYTAKATATGGRDGRVNTVDNKIATTLSVPGGKGDGPNPEQFFAAGYSACFGQALKAMADQNGLNPSSVTVNADVNLHKDQDGFYLSVKLDGELPGLSQADAEKLMKEAHKICPYSKAVGGGIVVQLSVSGNEVKAAA